MGFLNARKKYLTPRGGQEIIRARIQAVKAGDHTEVARLDALLRTEQAACPHPEVDHRTNRSIPGGAPTRRYKKGDSVTWCFRCGKILAHNGTLVGDRIELPMTVWERLLDDSPFDE